jgi:hypothetical protein
VFAFRRRLEDIGGCFVVKASNATGRSYLSVAGEGVAGRTIARLLSRDAVRRITAGAA